MIIGRMGKRVRTLEGLQVAARNGKALTGTTGPFLTRYLPAAFVIGWPGYLILRYIRHGIYIYIKGD